MARFDTSEIGSWEQDVATLAGSLVHEVKNPLSTLNINAQLLLEEWQQPASPKETRMVKRLEVMRSEIQRIERIVTSFLRFTQRQELELASCDLNDVLSELIGRHSEALERRGIRARFQPDSELTPIEADENLLCQVFLNLIRNAEQAMEEGGELIVRTHTHSAGAEIEFIDTGPGIPEDRLPKIFRPYFSSKSEGTGLGLPTSLEVIRGHGGKFLVESEVGKGSRFVVRLPRHLKGSS